MNKDPPSIWDFFYFLSCDVILRIYFDQYYLFSPKMICLVKAISNLITAGKILYYCPSGECHLSEQPL